MITIDKYTYVEMNLTVSDVANLFCELDEDQQALFFAEVGLITDEWESSLASQLQSVKDSKFNSDGARRVMRTIGEYADE